LQHAFRKDFCFEAAEVPKLEVEWDFDEQAVAESFANPGNLNREGVVALLN